MVGKYLGVGLDMDSAEKQALGGSDDSLETGGSYPTFRPAEVLMCEVP